MHGTGTGKQYLYTSAPPIYAFQNVASFLTKDLGLDWRLGAEWFESVLLDHDVCSNYGNWLYSAGLGNDPRENRKFNMVKQGLDYDPEVITHLNSKFKFCKRIVVHLTF